ncbi:MAG: hypothetical protein DSY33_00425 [Archaeoglobus sp.]|nr:MAG: hypothetical protein DSY33_00425 [Archaeoglobus sp.]
MFVQCPVCGNLQYRKFWQDDNFEYYVCEKCGNTLSIPLQRIEAL